MNKKYLVITCTILLLILTIYFVTKQEFIHNKFYRSITKNISLDLKLKIINSNLVKFFYVKLVTSNIKSAFKSSPKKTAKFRSIFKERYLLESDQVKINKLNNFENINNGTFKFEPQGTYDIFEAKYYGIKEYAILEHALKYKKKNNLLIYNQGHRGNPYEFSNFIEIKNHYKKKGFDVLALSMPVLGFNKIQVSFPGMDEKKGKHEIYHSFHDPLNPKKEPMSAFISGNYYLIKKIISENDYDKIYYIGISGGGWFVTMLSAFITEIDKSYSFASLVPLSLRYLGVKGDWEASKSKFYKDISYYDLFKLTTLDKKFKPNRYHTLVYNKYDDCCFGKPWSTIMRDVGMNLKSKYFKVEELDVYKHTIDRQFLFSQF